MRNTILSLPLSLVALVTAAEAGIMASGNPGTLPTMTQHNGNAGGFTISEDVAFDPSAGQWHKELVNSGGGGISSGVRVNITETFTNTGSDAWTDWHEEIISVTDIGGPQPGFLFDTQSLSVLVDDGGGFQPLSEGVDYSVTAIDYTGPGSAGDNMGWEAISIFFEPHALIQTGDALRIEKQIFEVNLDSDPWRPDEAAEIAQYPSIPEPSSLALAAFAGLAACVWQRRRRRRTLVANGSLFDSSGA